MLSIATLDWPALVGMRMNVFGPEGARDQKKRDSNRFKNIQNFT